jgi:hypothetical protein
MKNRVKLGCDARPAPDPARAASTESPVPEVETRERDSGKMNHKKKNMKLPIGLLSFMLVGLLLAGCSQTVTPSPNIFQRTQGQTAAVPPPSGFLGNDYSLLTPLAEGSDQQVMLRYTNAHINWSNYNAIIITPVTFWAVDDSKVSPAD